MKTIAFSLREKCERIRKVKVNETFATFRLLNLPTYIELEIVGIKDKQYPVAYHDLFGNKLIKMTEKIIFLAEVVKINFKRICDLTMADAALDLFPELSAEEFQNIYLKKIYKGKKPENYGCQTILKRIEKELPV